MEEESYEELDIFITNFTMVDQDIFQMWLDGFNSCETVQLFHQSSVDDGAEMSMEEIASDVVDHYRAFELLERVLTHPMQLCDQSLFQMDEPIRQEVISKYFSLDDVILKELLGLRLSSKTRKDLDEIADKTGIRLGSCRRQFDNLRRVYRAMEDVPGNLVTNIQAMYDMPAELARKYSVVVFFSSLGFDLKKPNIENLSFNDLFQCGRAMMARWTYTCSGPEYYDTEIDREFMMDLRECKVLVDNEKEHQHRVCMSLKNMMSETGYAELELNFKTYAHAIIELAYGLHRSREFKHFFSECFEKCVEPLRNSKWTKTELINFLTTFETTATEIKAMREGELIEIWHRFMSVATRCIVTMY